MKHGLLSYSEKVFCFSPEEAILVLENPVFNDESNAIFSKTNVASKDIKLNIVYTNADTLDKLKKIELEELIIEKEAHIIIITEVFPKNSKFKNNKTLYSLENYDMFLEEKEGRGVAIFTLKNLKATEVIIDNE